MSQFHRSNPAPGVRVDAVPRDRVHISPMQRRLARTPVTNCKGEYAGVFRTEMVGGATGLGMMSCVSTLRSPVNATGGLSTPGYKRRSHCKRPKNPAFANPIPDKYEYAHKRMEDAFKCLRVDHLRICTTKGDTTRLEDRYEQMRDAFLLDWPEQEKRLTAMEEAHNRSIK